MLMNLAKTLHAGLVCALAAAIASVASAGPVTSEFGPNLVSNGSFENTSVIAGSGWTVSGAFTSEGFDYFIDTDPADAENGTHSFAGGAIGDLGFISQNLSTTAGVHYNIHLWLANLSGFADGTEIQVRWGGIPVYTATDILGFNYRQIVIDPIATGSSTALSIGLRDDSFFLNVDNISVRAVPEPTTLALLLGGMGIAGLARRRASTA
jgi:PEP-CTERM motif